MRPLSMDEGRALQKITRTAKDPVRLRRAIVVMMSGQGQTVRDIASLLQVSEDYVRDVIHAFNERGFDALDPKWSGGPRRRSVSSSAAGSARSPGRPPRTGRGRASGQARGGSSPAPPPDHFRLVTAPDVRGPGHAGSQSGINLPRPAGRGAVPAQPAAQPCHYQRQEAARPWT